LLKARKKALDKEEQGTSNVPAKRPAEAEEGEEASSKIQRTEEHEP